ncbi:hypothetical protein [Bremerella volcania]|uniref:hypothetical protein n=1 Tax=Bremerella volcania TaxID=2527984 RepID=UPI0011A3789E|nr:hypothetical protein [Bremerella volcania]
MPICREAYTPRLISLQIGNNGELKGPYSLDALTFSSLKPGDVLYLAVLALSACSKTSWADFGLGSFGKEDSFSIFWRELVGFRMTQVGKAKAECS